MKRDRGVSGTKHDIAARDRAEAKRARKAARRRASPSHQHDREAANLPGVPFSVEANDALEREVL